MSQPADQNAPAGGTPAAEPVDPAMRLLFETIESEAPASDEASMGMDLSQAIADTPAEDKPADDKSGKPDDKPAKQDDKPAAAAAPAPDASKPADEPPIRGRKTPIPPKPSLEHQDPAPVPAPKPPDEPETELVDEEREQLKLARFAEQMDPVKHKGLGDKMLKFFKAHATYLSEQTAKDPEVKFDQENLAYQAWLKANKVALTPLEARSVEREMIKAEARAELAPEVSGVKHEFFVRDNEPVVKREADQHYGDLVRSALPEEVKAAIQKDGMAKAEELFPMEIEIARESLNHGVAAIEEFMRLTRINPETKRAMKPFDKNNDMHRRLEGFINHTCTEFEEGRKGLMREGRRFVDRLTYFNLPPQDRPKYWTFSNAEIVQRLKQSVHANITTRIQAEQTRREKQGWVRKAPAQAAPSTPPASSAPAAQRPAPIPAEGGQAAAGENSKAMSLLLGTEQED